MSVRKAKCIVTALWLASACGQEGAESTTRVGDHVEVRDAEVVTQAVLRPNTSECVACWSEENACLEEATAQWGRCEREGGDSESCRSVLRRGIAACLDAGKGCDERVADNDRPCEHVVPGAAELAGSWSGAVVLDGEAIAVVVVVDAAGNGIVTGTWNGLSGGTTFALDGWDGERIVVWHRDRPWRGTARLIGDALHVEAPEIGKVVLSRQ